MQLHALACEYGGLGMPADMARRADAVGGRFAADGVAAFENMLCENDLRAMEALFPVLGAGTPGARSAAFTPEAQAWLGAHDGLNELARRLGGGAMCPIRYLAFDKSADANWFVPWHQDRAADGRERLPAELENMLALRIHLDDCDENCGPLEVIAGSHGAGRLDASAIAGVVADGHGLLCLAARGDIVAMRPLAVYRSQRARVPRARRVLHIEYTARDRAGRDDPNRTPIESRADA